MLLPTACLLTCLVSSLQDAPSPTPPASSTPPAAAPESDDPARAAVELLDRARTRLYDIQSAGLDTVAFRVPIRISAPTGETFPLGNVSVNWAVSSDPQVAVTVSDALPAELAQNSKEISFQLEAQGRQVLRFIDNDIFSGLLQGFDPSVVGLVGDLTQVHFEPKADQAGAIPVDWFFDANDVPVRFDMSITQHDRSMSISYQHSWAPASESDPTLVLQELAIVQEMDSMKNEITTTLDHETINGLVMLVGYTESGLTPAGDTVTNRVQLEDLSVTVRGDG